VPTTTTDDGVALYYETDGSGETVAFVGEAGLGAWQWSWQHGAVAGPYRSLVWDLRGTGRSDTPADPYDVDRLARDLETVLSDAGVQTTHLVGVGLGGMVALRYAREFTRAETLTLCNTAAAGAEIEYPTLHDLCEPRADPAELKSSLSVAFSEDFRAANPDLLDRICTWRQEEDADSDGFDAQVSAMEGFKAGPLYELTLPTLVCHGLEDPVIDAAVGRKLAEDLPRGSFQAVEGRHLCFVEYSRAVTDRMLTFIDPADR
jgi:3-oxoadipate enol-lactonase